VTATLPFDNRFVAELPGDPEQSPRRRQVLGAAWSPVAPTPVAAPRLDSWATCPSTQTSPSRPIHSATLRATVRTGQGASGVEGEVTPRACQTGEGPPPGSPRTLGDALEGATRRATSPGAARGQRAVLDRLTLSIRR